MPTLQKNMKFQIIDWYSDDYVEEESSSSSDSDDTYKPQKDNSLYRKEQKMNHRAASKLFTIGYLQNTCICGIFFHTKHTIVFCCIQ